MKTCEVCRRAVDRGQYLQVDGGTVFHCDECVPDSSLKYPPSHRCKLCNARELCYYDPTTRAELRMHTLCFACNFWRKRAEAKDIPESVVVGGRAYWVEPSSPPGADTRWNGFGGAVFKIRFHDGRYVETNNLSGNGQVPDHFRERLSDNAVFEWTERCATTSPR